MSRMRGASRQPGFAHQVADIEWRSARAAGRGGLLVHALAPLALDAFERNSGWHMSCVGHGISSVAILGTALKL